MPYVYITSFSGPPATITVCDTVTNTICYTYPTQLTDLGPFPFIINLPSPDFDDVGGITLTAQSVNGCSIVQSNICSILPTPSPTSAPIPCFEVIINGDFNTDLTGWSAESGPSQWVWDSFNGGSAFYPGEDDNLKLAQTGYTFLEGFNYTISYDIYSPDIQYGGGFVYPILGLSQPDYPSGYPFPPLSAWTHYSYALESNGDNTLKMMGYVTNTGGVYLDNVSACFTYGPCYYMEFVTNDNFSVSGTVDYVDCNGVLQTYTANTEGTFYLCAIQSAGSVDIDVVDTSYLCTDAGGGTWVPPYLESPTPTPSNPPTPTPTPVLGFIYETISFPYSFATTDASRDVVISIQNMPLFNGQTLRITAGGSEVLGTYNGSEINYNVPVTGTSGTIVISGVTSTAGEITSIRTIEVESVLVSNVPITATTAELSKLTSAQQVTMNSKVWCTGDIQLLSGLTATTNILLNEGNYTGDIQYLPNSIQYLGFGTSSYKSSNTVYGNIGNLPSDIRSMGIYGLNTISGNISSISSLFTVPSTGSRFFLNGHNTITGDMSYLPNVWYIGINDEPIGSTYNFASTGNTITGNLTLKSYLREIKIGGGNTITGDLSATTVPSASNFAIFNIAGNNTIGGSVSLLRLPKTEFVLLGDNIVSGDISTIININSNPLIEKIDFRNKGQQGLISTAIVVASGNTLSGNISSLQSCISLKDILFGGNNTLTGNLSSLLTITPNTLKGLFIVSNNNTINNANFNISDSDIVVNNPYISLVTNNIGNGMNSTQVNNFLKYLDAKCTTTLSIPAYIKILGTGHSAPTGDGLTAKTNLTNKNFIVITN